MPNIYFYIVNNIRNIIIYNILKIFINIILIERVKITNREK